MAAERQAANAAPAVGAAAPGSASGLATTTDQFLGGRLTLQQPHDGYRAAIDPVLLAAAVAAPAGGRIADLGCGVGTAGLCALMRLPGLAGIGIDLQEPLATLAASNATANGLADRYETRHGSILDKTVMVGLGTINQVIVNPPYLPQGEASLSADPIKALANVESDARLADWVAVAARIVRPGGAVTFIHRADRLPELLALMRERLGSLVILPIQPKAGEEAHRVLVQGRKDKRAPARLLAPLVLHTADGTYTDVAQHLLRDAGALEL
ncbi:MAG TPA: methyltransferase [Terriglobales bacterium]|nr:methyltransferase [Terriglobales bacterium]